MQQSIARHFLLKHQGSSKRRPTVHTDRGSKWNVFSNGEIFLRRKEDFISESSLIRSCSTLRRIQRSREGKIRIYNNVDSVFEYRTNVNLDSNWLENYMYRNNVYFNAIRVIGNDKENLRAIHKDTKKEVLRINFEENGEENDDTGDEEGEGEDKDESQFDIESSEDIPLFIYHNI
ncbi:myb-like protein X [Vespula maculifrons]|uniref:Myb-like protein X n=1 Tax=Vespula maculifrons TaxID=7453 RepID=A0ABD2CM31_VESMC